MRGTSNGYNFKIFIVDVESMLMGKGGKGDNLLRLGQI